MRLIYDANTGQYIRIVNAKSQRSREREKQEPQRRPQPTVEEWENALNHRNIAQEDGKANAEVDAFIQTIASQYAGANSNANITVQCSTLPFGFGVVRVSVADQAQRSALITNSSWSVTATIVEGYKGAKYPTINQYTIPIVGKTIPVKGDFVYVLVQNFSNPARSLNLAVSIEPGDNREMFEARDSTTGAGFPVFAPQWATHVEATVENPGVGVGDIVTVTSPDGVTSVIQYLYGEGRRIPLGSPGGRVFYTRALLGPKKIIWSFWGQK